MINDQKLPRRLRLSTRRDVERRVHELIWILRDKYRDIRLVGERVFNPLNLYSTQKYLESDKLGLVLRETLFHGYNAPVIVIRGKASRYYVVDGHHRVRVMLWLGQGVKGFLLDIPGYEPQYSTRINNIELINPPEKVSSPIINTWKHMVNIIHFLEKKHGRIAYVWREKILIEKLVPTEKIIGARIESLVDEPILVYKYNNKYYVIDGHNRVYKAMLNGVKQVDAVVFTLNTRIGIIETAERIGLKSFYDLDIK
jgi:hypothetical protein